MKKASYQYIKEAVGKAPVKHPLGFLFNVIDEESFDNISDEDKHWIVVTKDNQPKLRPFKAFTIDDFINRQYKAFSLFIDNEKYTVTKIMSFFNLMTHYVVAQDDEKLARTARKGLEELLSFSDTDMVEFLNNAKIHNKDKNYLTVDDGKYSWHVKNKKGEEEVFSSDSPVDAYLTALADMKKKLLGG